MTKLSLDLTNDPTLDAADAALEDKNAREHRLPRGYLGMSGLGYGCDRRVWGSFRWVARERLDAVSIKRIEDGHAGEEVQADRIAAVPGVVLVTAARGGGQLEVGRGHLRGHLDGIVFGLLQAPRTWHVWEHKQVNEKKAAKLQKLRDELGEKNALAEWDPVYYTQAQLYMLGMNMSRHYLTAATPGGRSTVSVRTEFDSEFAHRAQERGERLALKPRAPAKLQPHDRECYFCPLKKVCHEREMPARNCRTCIHATPLKNGTWRCQKFDTELSKEVQLGGGNCPQHRIIPDLIDAEQVDAELNGPELWIEYETASGKRWRDTGPNSTREE